MKRLSTIFSLLVLVSVLYVIAITPEKPADTFSGSVAWVSDGDTIKISGHEWPVRIWGIDAPERELEAGQRSRDFLQKLVKGKTLTCEKIVVDKYRRTVAKCFFEERDIARIILNAGHATEYCSFSGGYYGKC